MSTASPRPTLDDALISVPTVFRTRLIKHYRELKDAFTRAAFDACGSRAGKFCETMIRFLQNALEATYTPFGTQINLYDEARRLEKLPTTIGPEPFRVFIPRALAFLYTLRNKRGFAHVGGDLDSSPIDAATCVRVADWSLCELMRVVHSLSLEDAQSILDDISAKQTSMVWSVAGKRRVLQTSLDYKSQALVLLYSDGSGGTLVEDLFAWTEYSNLSMFKTQVLRPLHKDRLIEWDQDTDAAIISPTGIARVEKDILPRVQ